MIRKEIESVVIKGQFVELMNAPQGLLIIAENFRCFNFEMYRNTNLIKNLSYFGKHWFTTQTSILTQ